MNWIKQNTFLSGLLAVLIVGVLALGYFFVSARGQYTDAKDRLSSAYAAKSALESKKPFPNDDNANAMRKLVTDYRTTAEAFTNKMLNAQAVMPSGVRVARFQEDLGQKVSAVVGAAELSGVTLPEGFYLGMEKYQSQVPLEDAVDRLQFQLDATVRLTDWLFANGVTEFGIRRQTMPFETRQARTAADDRRGNRRRGGNSAPAREEKKEDPVSETYPMELVLEITPRGFQDVMNALSNTSASIAEEEAPAGAEQAGEYYFVTRWMRVENEIAVGPERTEEEEPEDEDFVDEELEGDDTGFEDAASSELNMIFGTEKIRAYLAIDLVRFLKANAESAE